MSSSANYVCTPVWYSATDTDVISQSSGPHAEALNITCVVNTGTVQFQVKDDQDNWFTPADSAYTVSVSNLVRLPKSNMPDIRIIATGDAVFSVAGAL